jgi:hypothetical protein
LGAEAFFCSLDVLSGGQGIAIEILIQKNIKIFSDVNFVHFLVMKTLGPDCIQIGIQLGSGSNEYGSEKIE